jgi:hypothetical protein
MHVHRFEDARRHEPAFIRSVAYLQTIDGTHGPKQPSFVVRRSPVAHWGGTTSQIAAPP